MAGLQFLAVGSFVLGTVATVGAQDAVKKGQELYAAQKCSMCHSVAGVGNKKYPLDGLGGKLSAADIKEWLVNPDGQTAKLAEKPVMKMKSYKTLSAPEIDALVAYVGSLK